MTIRTATAADILAIMPTTEEIEAFAATIGDAPSRDMMVLRRAWKIAREQELSADMLKGTKCWRCNGTGTYVWGTITNGIPAHQGTCFKCGGDGKDRDGWAITG